MREGGEGGILAMCTLTLGEGLDGLGDLPDVPARSRGPGLLHQVGGSEAHDELGDLNVCVCLCACVCELRGRCLVIGC